MRRARLPQVHAPELYGDGFALVNPPGAAPLPPPEITPEELRARRERAGQLDAFAGGSDD